MALTDDAARAIYGRLELLAERSLKLHTDGLCAFCGVNPHVEACMLCVSCLERRYKLAMRFQQAAKAATTPRVHRTPNAFSAFTTPEWLPHPDD